MQKDLFGDQKYFSFIVGLGIIIGVIIGALTDNFGLWIALGIVTGGAIGVVRAKLA